MRGKIRTYTVFGQGCFPVDMLRYDAAEVVGGLKEPEDFRGRAMQPLRSITVSSKYPPTIGRWESFGWKVRNV